MTNGSEHAFPHMHLTVGEGVKLEGGLSKREYFAAQVMANMALAVKAAAGTNEEAARVLLGAAARASVASADALLEELNRGKQ